MRVKVHELKGITTELANALKSAGINDSSKFLAAAGKAADRKALAAKYGVDTRHLLELVNRADLARIKGVGAVYSDLLENVGVDSVVELRTRNADNLFAKIGESTEKLGIKRAPRIEEVRKWIEQAKQLERAVHY
ncbi:MAG: DUF4332 domain-containing protein [Caldilineaceae bacterium]